MRRIALVTFLTAAAGCQGYAFEELTSSVLTQERVFVNVPVSQEIDILFVLDNSGSMAGEQLALARSFRAFSERLEGSFGPGNYRIAVVTTGMESGQECPQCCPRCDASRDDFCLNESGESGRFQDRLGTPLRLDPPEFTFTTEPACRVVTSANKDCFFDSQAGEYGRGTVFVGTHGCGFEQGLEAMRRALEIARSAPEANPGFLQNPDAALAVIVVSDEEDCGRWGDFDPRSGNECYFAARGVGPDGSSVDRTGRPYGLTPVWQYRDFLLGLKPDRPDKVKFVAVVGVEDEDDPRATEIRYASSLPTTDILPACTAEACAGDPAACLARPGTRYVELADLFDLANLDEIGNGLVGSICQADFSPLMERVADFVGCPREFRVTREVVDEALISVRLNDREVPRFTCTSAEGLVCRDAEDPGCPEGGACAPSWTYRPAAGGLGGHIVFAGHFDPCELYQDQGEFRFEVVCAVK
jgi:hypothetical protein